MEIGKAPRAQSQETLHADVFCFSCTGRVMASVCTFCFGELGPVVSHFISGFGLNTALHFKGGGVTLGLPRLDVWAEVAFISAQSTDTLKKKKNDSINP